MDNGLMETARSVDRVAASQQIIYTILLKVRAAKDRGGRLIGSSCAAAVD
jgi:hypothetical protein